MMSGSAVSRRRSETGPARRSEDGPFAPRDMEAYLWATPNSRRVSILLEELGFSYAVRPVNIRAGEQFAEGVIRLNPYGKLPIVTWRDEEGDHVLSESGAILLHFAERCGRFLPAAGESRRQALQWLMVSLSSLGPMSGQAHHWTELAPERNSPAIDHHVALVDRVYRLLDGRLASHTFLAGGRYSIADIAAYPWIERSRWAGVDRSAYRHVSRWLDMVSTRPAVRAGMVQPAGVVLEPAATFPRNDQDMQEGASRP